MAYKQELWDEAKRKCQSIFFRRIHYNSLLLYVIVMCGITGMRIFHRYRLQDIPMRQFRNALDLLTAWHLMQVAFYDCRVFLLRLLIRESTIRMKSFCILQEIQGFILCGIRRWGRTCRMPSDAVVSMAVGGYQATTGASYLESGRGFLSGGYTKPDFVAPAVEVSGKGLRGQYIRKTGTSVAAAITAGACAQILEWAVVRKNGLGINSVDIKNFLIRGCRRTLEQSYPNPQNGFGQLDVQQSFELIRKE